MMRTSAGSVMMYSVVVSEFTYRWILKSITGNPETLTTNSTSLANNSPQGVRHVYRSSNSKNGNSSRDNETESGDNKAIYLHVPTGNQGIFEGPDPLAEVNIKVNTNDFHDPPPEANSTNSSYTNPDHAFDFQTDIHILFHPTNDCRNFISRTQIFKMYTDKQTRLI